MSIAQDEYGLAPHVAGNISEAPSRTIKTEALILKSPSPYYNLMSRAFSYVSQEVAQAGGSIDYPFAGYLVNTVGSPLYGTPASRYAPSLLVPNGKQAQLLTKGAFFATYQGVAPIGYHVWFSVVDGSLLILPPSQQPDSNYRWGFAKVITYNVQLGAGLVNLYVDVAAYEQPDIPSDDFLITPQGEFVESPDGGLIIVPS